MASIVFTDARFHIKLRDNQPDFGQLSSIFVIRLFGVLISRADLLHVLGRVFVEILLAVLAAQFDLLALEYEDEGFAHLAKFVTRNRAGFEFVGFGLVLGVGGDAGERRGKDGEAEECCSDEFQLFHKDDRC